MRHAGRYADVEFGRLQARDLLQHLWTGAISNSPVDIVQGSKSVEVRPVGISKVRPAGRGSAHTSYPLNRVCGWSAEVRLERGWKQG